MGEQEQPHRFRMEVFCGPGTPLYVFVLSLGILQEGVTEHG